MAKRKTSRRQFLRGESAAREIADLAGDHARQHKGASGDATSSLSSSDKGPPAEFQFHVTHYAMACDFELTLAAGCWGEACEHALLALGGLDRLEEMLSTFIPESELSRVNDHAAESPQPVSPEVFDVLAEGLHLYEITGGAFDMTSGSLSRVWGFHRQEGRLPDDAALREALAGVGSNYVQLDEKEQTVSFGKPGIEIDLGAIGKGYGIDWCSRQLLDNGVNNFLFHGGGSSALAFGGDDMADPESRWRVGLPHPLKVELRLGELQLTDQALGTSGSARQFFYHRGRRYGHILDPRTGKSVEGVLSVTVLAPSSTWADALATALFVMGPDEAEKFCADNPEVSALFVLPGRQRESTEFVSFGIPEEIWRPA